MFNKWLTRINEYAKSINFSSGAMRYILWYAALLIIGCTVYLTAWCALWLIEGTPDLKSLLAFLHEVASASWIAVIGFICKGLVDSNNNGIPDEFEKESSKDARGDLWRTSEVRGNVP